MEDEILKLKGMIFELIEEQKHLKQEIEALKTQKKSPSRNIDRNKKPLIKAQISKLASQGIEINEIKHEIVDKQRLCAKASFYRYVEELKKEGKVEYVEITYAPTRKDKYI